MSFVLISSLRVRGANMMAGNYALTGAQPMGLTLFAHALCARASTRLKGVAIIHHDFQPLGEFLPDPVRGARLHPHQHRAATYLANGRTDYVAPRDRRAQEPTLSVQPVAKCLLEFSLLIEAEGPADDLERHLFSARALGGEVLSVGAVKEVESLENLKIPNGFFLIDRSDLMSPYTSPLDAFIDLLGHDSGEAWLTPAVMAYAATTDFRIRAGVRLTHDDEVPLHAYCEPLLGLAQFVSTRHYGKRFQGVPFWTPAWVDDVFVVRHPLVKSIQAPL